MSQNASKTGRQVKRDKGRVGTEHSVKSSEYNLLLEYILLLSQNWRNRQFYVLEKAECLLQAIRKVYPPYKNIQAKTGDFVMHSDATAVIDIETAKTLPNEEVLKRLGVTESGLSDEEATQRLALYGLNALVEHR